MDSDGDRSARCGHRVHHRRATTRATPTPARLGQYCSGGLCYDDPCDPNPCPAGQYCSSGSCYDSDRGDPNPCPAGQLLQAAAASATLPTPACRTRAIRARPASPACAIRPPTRAIRTRAAPASGASARVLRRGDGLRFLVNDQDCANVTQAWWCDASGVIRLNDCITQCTRTALPYACCGYDPTRGDDACLCCGQPADCSGLTCEGGPPADPCNTEPVRLRGVVRQRGCAIPPAPRAISSTTRTASAAPRPVWRHLGDSSGSTTASSSAPRTGCRTPAAATTRLAATTPASAAPPPDCSGLTCEP